MNLDAVAGALILPAGASVLAGGAATLTAAAELTVDAGSVVDAGTVATLAGGEDGAAELIALEGTFAAPLIEVRMGDGGDGVTLAPVALNGYTQVWGGAGANQIVLSLPTIDLAHKLDSGMSGPAALVNGTSAQRHPRRRRRQRAAAQHGRRERRRLVVDHRG